MAEVLRWHGRAMPDTVGMLRRLLTEHAVRIGAGDDVRDRLRLAVTEAVTNVVMHAYRHAPEPGDVIVVVEQEHDQLFVSVCDEGLGMVPRIDSPGLGLGLGLMAQMADAFDILKRPEGGVEVRLQFALDGPLASAAA
jgi:serine/threonine-protein kinase RsbW